MGGNLEDVRGGWGGWGGNLEDLRGGWGVIWRICVVGGG